MYNEQDFDDLDDALNLKSMNYDQVFNPRNSVGVKPATTSMGSVYTSATRKPDYSNMTFEDLDDALEYDKKRNPKHSYTDSISNMSMYKPGNDNSAYKAYKSNNLSQSTNKSNSYIDPYTKQKVSYEDIPIKKFESDNGIAESRYVNSSSVRGSSGLNQSTNIIANPAESIYVNPKPVAYNKPTNSTYANRPLDQSIYLNPKSQSYKPKTTTLSKRK